MMRKFLVWVMVGLLALVPSAANAQLGSVQYSFTPGSTIRSSEINSLFTYIYANSVLRSGGTLTGTLTTLALLPTTDNASDIGSAALSYNDGWFDGTLTVATLVPTTITCTGCVTSTNVLNDTLVNADINSAAAIVITKLATFTSAELATQLTNESGTGVVAYTISPAFTTPNLGTPSAVTLTNGTGLPWAGVSKSGSSLADLATRAVANLSDGSNVALLSNAQTFAARQTISMANSSGIGDALLTITGTNTGQYYGVRVGNAWWLSRGNNTDAYVTSNTDLFTYTTSAAASYLSIGGGGFSFNTIASGTAGNGISQDVRFGITNAGNWTYNGNIMDSTGTPSVTSGASSVSGRDYAMVVVGATHSANAVIAFGNTWTNPPVCTATVSTGGGIYPARASTTTTALTLNFTSAPASGDIYVLCRGY